MTYAPIHTSEICLIKPGFEKWRTDKENWKTFSFSDRIQMKLIMFCMKFALKLQPT